MKIINQQVLVVVICLLFNEAVSVCNTCIDSGHHKSEPGPENSLFDVCSPWSGRSCCTTNTSYEAHQQGGDNTYGFNYDHCADAYRPMSERCRRHFVEDNCFYECSPNIGPWIVNEGNSYRNQRYKNVPLCLSECNAWWEDCKDDYTCKENWSTGWDWSKDFNQCPESQEKTCRRFRDIFPTHTDLCEKLYPNDFKVVLSDEPCMVMWFSPGTDNPNDKVVDYYLEKGSTCSSAGRNYIKVFNIFIYIVCLLCLF